MNPFIKIINGTAYVIDPENDRTQPADQGSDYTADHRGNIYYNDAGGIHQAGTFKKGK